MQMLILHLTVVERKSSGFKATGFLFLFSALASYTVMKAKQ